MTEATRFAVYDQGTGVSLERILGRKRRSRARLGRQAKPSAARRRRAASPARQTVQITGSAIVNVALAGALAALLVWFFVSDQFYVNQVSIEGNQRVASEAIAAASGIHGYSIFWIDGAEVAAAITGSMPPIRQVRVRYGFPNAVTLIVEEQGEQVMWEVGGERYWVDDDGHLHSAQGGQTPELLVRDARTGLPAQLDTDAVTAARQLALLLPELDAVEYVPARGLYYTHPLGWVVYLGVGDDMARKVNVLNAIEQRLSAEGAPQPSEVDIRYADNPYYRYPGE